MTVPVPRSPRSQHEDRARPAAQTTGAVCVMITRREMLQVSAATAALMAGGGPLTRAFAQQKLTQEELLKFDASGNVTLLHITDIHGQLMPVYFREPTVNLGVGDAKGQPPHVTGADFLKRFGIAPQSAGAYAMPDQDFTAL